MISLMIVLMQQQSGPESSATTPRQHIQGGVLDGRVDVRLERDEVGAKHVDKLLCGRFVIFLRRPCLDRAQQVRLDAWRRGRHGEAE